MVWFVVYFLWTEDQFLDKRTKGHILFKDSRMFIGLKNKKRCEVCISHRLYYSFSIFSHPIFTSERKRIGIDVEKFISRRVIGCTKRRV